MARLEGSDPGRDRSNVLIVDDERGPRESLRMILSPQHRVLMAEDALQALEILRSRPVDAVTLDLNMPGMKGDELMRTIRGEFPQVEVIIITGCGSVETAVDGIRHGVFDYLTKPFDVVEVSSTIRRALARAESRLRLAEFLRGIGRVLGENRDPGSTLEELDASQALQARLRAALQDPALSPPAERAELSAARTSECLEALAETIEAREPHKRGHARRVALRKQAGSVFDPALMKELVAIAESGLCSTDPLLGLSFVTSEDPVDTIASATPWIGGDR